MISPEGRPSPGEEAINLSQEREGIDAEAESLVSSFVTWLSENPEANPEDFTAKINEAINRLEVLSARVGTYGSIWKGYYHCKIGLIAHRRRKELYPSDRLNSDFDAVEEQLEHHDGPETQMWLEKLDNLLG